MKKVYLTKAVQKTKEFYAMVEDPRLIVDLLPDVEAGAIQENQRPWSLPKVQEISSYVAGKLMISDDYKALGIIPNNPILVLDKSLQVKKELIKIEVDGIVTEEERYYLLLPETEDEKAKYKGAIESIDGQHRLLSFSSDYRDPDLKDRMPYTMVFSVFENLSQNERKEIFMITNEKQDKVSINLIRYLKKALKLLGEDEKTYDVIYALNDEPFSVLRQRIMIGAEKIKKGYTENQLSKIIKKSGTMDLLEKYVGDDVSNMALTISNYLEAWEQVYNVSFQNPQKDTLTKISGLRYVLFIFPDVYQLLVQLKKKALTDNFKELIEKLPEATKIDNVFEDEHTVLAFRGEGATTKLAKDHAKMLTSFIGASSATFNPSAGI